MNDQIETIPESVTPDSVTPDSEEPKVLTISEYKKLMRQYFTVTRPMVAACGHKINIDSAPRTSCEHCLFAWFNSNGERTSMLDEMFRMPGGKQRMIQEQGIKFVKAFGSFMATINKMKQEAVSVKPMPEGGVPDPTPVHIEPVQMRTQTFDEWNKEQDEQTA